MITLAFKDRLKHLRSERGMTQEDLGKALDVPASTIRRYESSSNLPKHERLQAIADYFDCKVDYLLDREDWVDGLVNKLSPFEKKMLEKFQGLSEEDQEFVLGFMEKLKKE